MAPDWTQREWSLTVAVRSPCLGLEYRASREGFGMLLELWSEVLPFAEAPKTGGRIRTSLREHGYSLDASMSYVGEKISR